MCRSNNKGVDLWRPILYLPTTNPKAPVAQWIEHQPPELGVAGSIPAGRANKNKRSGRKSLAFLIPKNVFPTLIPTFSDQTPWSSERCFSGRGCFKFRLTFFVGFPLGGSFDPASIAQPLVKIQPADIFVTRGTRAIDLSSNPVLS
jgi:hypothetical protein